MVIFILGVFADVCASICFFGIGCFHVKLGYDKIQVGIDFFIAFMFLVLAFYFLFTGGIYGTYGSFQPVDIQ